MGRRVTDLYEFTVTKCDDRRNGRSGGGGGGGRVGGRVLLMALS